MFKANFIPVKQLNCLLLVLLVVSSLVIFSSFEIASAATALTRKWAGYVAGGGEALLTADVRSDIAGEEVFHAGGPVAPNLGGRVTCLNGRTGAQIWTRTITNVGDTCQIHMADMDNNGDLEIVVPLQQPAGVYILQAENGNTMFSATSLGGGRIDSSPVSGDVDRDGYPDLFIGVMGYEEVEPINGKVIRYEWNPSTNSIVERDRVTVWHPCAGGLSLCDTDNDGRIELYMNERDVYFGDGSWGRGIVSFWADTLDVRWQIYDWGASSNIPMLTDVNKDGVIDVVCTDLSAGVCVLNSTDGKPLKNSAGTILYQTRIPGRHNHYQSSVYDIDGDGNIEVLSGDGFEGDFDFVTIFDLWSWTLDASIDTTLVGGRSWKGPTVGEINGDGRMDIVVVTFDHISNSNNGTVQVYDRNYNLVYVNTGLRHRAIESVVQDVDRNDGGLNELLVLTQGGVIYCFETPGIASNPRARSEVQFYSESRRGASEYLPFERPVTSPSPDNPEPTSNSAPTQTTPTLSGTTDLDNLVVTPQGTYDADGDRVTNIYNWQKDGVSLANINLPFETKTDSQDEYSGLAATRDYAYGASGAVFGATWTPDGKVGGAYSFNGNDFIRVEESNNRYDGGGSWTEMSLECWVKGSSTSNERLILKTDRYETRVVSYRLDCRNLGNQLLFSWNASGRGPVLYSSTTSGVNDWHHIVCTYKSGVGSRIYVDGILANSSLSASYTGNIINTGGPFEIAFGSGSDFIGLVDEVRLYSFEVSASMTAQRFADTTDGLSSNSIVSSDDTEVGDQWRCQVTPNDGKTDGSTLNTVTRTIVEAGSGYTLTVNTIGSGSVTRNPNQASYASGTVVTLTAMPATGWSFNGWSEDLSGTANPTTITMTSNKIVTATFTENPPSGYSLTVNVVGSGSVIKNPNQAIYTSGTVVTLSAVPDSGYAFSGWSGALSGSTNPTSITMDSNKAVTATFTPVSGENWFTDGFESGNLASWDGSDGSASVSTDSPYQGTYHLRGTLGSGANNGWSGVYKSITGINPSYLRAYVYFNAPPNTDNEDQWVLCYSQSTTGSALAYAGIRRVSGTLYWAIWYISSGSALTYSLGSPYTSGWHNLELAISRGASNDGWVELYVDGVKTCSAYNLDHDARALNYARVGFSYSDAPSAASTTVYIDDVTIDATTPSTPTEYSLTVNVVGSGSVTKTPNQAPYASGTVVTLTAVPASGWSFSGWSEDLTGSANPNTITMTSNKIVTATFTQNPPSGYSLTVNVVGSGSVTKNPNQSTYTSGSAVTLTAVAANGWVFSGWSGALSGSTNPTTILMNDDKAVTATFQEIPSGNTIFSDDFSSGSFSAWSSTYANPSISDGKAVFTVPTGDGTQCYAQKDQLAIDSDGVFSVSSRVSFNTIPTNGQGNSAIYFSKIANPSTNAVVYAFVDGSQHFGLWIGEWPNYITVYDTATVQANTYYDVTIELDNSNQLIKLMVGGQTKITHAYTAYSAFQNSNSVNIIEGIAANYHWAEVQVKLDEVVVTGDTLVPPTGYSLTVNVVGSGSVTKNPNQASYTSGTVVSLTAVPASGYIFSGWSGALSGSANPASITMDGNKVVTATFVTSSPGTYVFADGFESGSFSAWPGTTTTTGGSATVTTSPVHSGSYSGSFAISSGAGTRRAYSFANVGSLSDVRASAYIYLPSGLSLSSAQSLWLVQFADSGGSVLASFGVRADASGLRWSVQSGNWPYAVGSAVPSSGGWYLLEAYFTHAASGPTLVLSVNGAEVATLSQNTSAVNSVVTARLGACYYIGSVATTVYADDFTVDSL